MKSICIIPIYNEYDKLNKLFSKIKKNKHKNFGLTYLAINNGSSDQSLNLIKKHKIKYINLKRNYGVGYALMSGYLYAKKNRYDYILHLAGNGKMDPAQIKNFLKADCLIFDSKENTEKFKYYEENPMPVLSSTLSTFCSRN